MQQMSVSADAVHTAVDCVGEAGASAARALAHERIGHSAVGVVNDG